jgi:hypothetical protein
VPLDFSTIIYSKTQDVFGRSVVVTPIASQPGQPAYNARGIYSTEPEDVLADEGTIFSDQRTILDVRDIEYTVIPLQGDHISIPATGSIPAAGDFEVINNKSNGGGETSLQLRRLVSTKP